MLNVLIACTGSVATIKLPILSKNIKEKLITVNVRIVVTEKAKHFISKQDLPDDVTIYEDKDEWAAWSSRGDPVLHIELGKWADILVIAPLDANTLAKIANGLCDNLLTCITRAWDLNKPLVFCPAMNTKMYKHPVTANQILLLESWGYHHVPAIEKKLMCGDTGVGGMADVDTIVNIIRSKIN